MHRFLALFFATGLLLATPAHAEEAERPHAILLQSTAGVIGGILVSGYGALLAEKLDFRTNSIRLLAPVPFALGAGLSVWLTGRWCGLRSNIWGAIVGAGVPVALAVFAAAIADPLSFRSMFPLMFVIAPALSVVGAVVGFEVAREPAGSGGDMLIRRSVADERIP